MGEKNTTDQGGPATRLPRLAFLPLYRAATWAAHRIGLASRMRFTTALPERRAAVERWLRRAGRGARGAIWIHAASVGEALTALPVVRRLRTARPDLPLVLTHTSAASTRWPAGWGVDHADYLPPDEPHSMAAVLDALTPILLVLMRADVWPELVSAALRRAIPVALAGGAVRPFSRRLHWPIRAAMSPLYAGLRYVGAASPADGERLRRLGCRSSRLEVTGDPRHDQVLERIPDLRPGGALAHWARQGAVLVAGSSDTLDARLLLTVLAAVRRSQPAARLLLCPHEPSQQHTAHVLRLALELGVMATRWTLNTAAPRENTDCVVVEHVGLLADLYALGQAAYVGGGLGPAGVHAVIEPAAYGLPVLMGSRGLSQDALALLAAGGAIALPTRGPGAALVNAWLTWLTHDAVRIRAGLAARGVLSAGAAARTTSRLLELI